MFKWLLYPLVKFETAFNIFQYITFRSAYAAITALLISFIAGPKLIEALTRLKLGQEVRFDGPQDHIKKQGTPTMGGLLMIISVMVSTLLWQDFNSFYTWLFIFALFAFGALGYVDDYLKIKRKNSDGLSPKVKTLWQLAISVALVLALRLFAWRSSYAGGGEFFSKIFFPFFKDAVLDLGVFYIFFAVFILVGTSNATNLTDGLDGLLTGLLMFAFIAFAAIAYVSGRADFAAYLQIPHIAAASELTVPLFAVIGACIGFLWYNCHPAEIFMGDTGSLAFGGVLGLTAIMLKKEILLALVGGVFVMEAFSVIIQVLHFKRTKKQYGQGRRIFRMAPLHHHYESLWKEEMAAKGKNWNESKVVVRFWILGMMFTIIALSTLKIN